MSANAFHEMACPECGLGGAYHEDSLEAVLKQYVIPRRAPCCVEAYRTLNAMLMLREHANTETQFVTGDRVLLTGQPDPARDGLYTVVTVR